MIESKNSHSSCPLFNDMTCAKANFRVMLCTTTFPKIAICLMVAASEWHTREKGEWRMVSEPRKTTKGAEKAWGAVATCLTNCKASFWQLDQLPLLRNFFLRYQPQFSTHPYSIFWKFSTSWIDFSPPSPSLFCQSSNFFSENSNGDFPFILH